MMPMLFLSIQAVYGQHLRQLNTGLVDGDLTSVEIRRRLSKMYSTDTFKNYNEPHRNLRSALGMLMSLSSNIESLTGTTTRLVESVNATSYPCEEHGCFQSAVEHYGVAFIILIFVVLLCLLGFMTSAIAERRTAKAIESGLPEEAQGLLSDLTFNLLAHSTTQVDHILVAPHGIYVIEQKNYVGKLYGTLEESHWRKWTQSRTLKLQNPFKQNQGHIRAIQSALKARELECINVVIINGRCKFDGIKPEWL
ncbi:nuclease-related domain-containing protein [Escherichia coli]